MKRYSFDGALHAWLRSTYGIAAMALLCCTAPTTAHAALPVPAALRVADADSSATRFLSPAEVEDGVRMRIQQLETRHQSRGSRRESEAPRDYRIDQPPPGTDVPLPADASGGEIFEERLEVMP